MFCDGCGNQLTEGASFCEHCGKAVGNAAAQPVRAGRIAGHLQLLGILWVVIGALRLLPGLFMMAFATMPMMQREIPLFVRGMFPVLGGIFSIFAVASIITAVGLLTKQPWGRMLAIVFGALNLLDIPFGTAIGIYTLWVLVGEQAGGEYRAITRS